MDENEVLISEELVSEDIDNVVTSNEEEDYNYEDGERYGYQASR